ncbi:MAG: HaeIII family restriction endonuclease [Actinomycetaceae bacterium]|nr:HaeIII family restriction endonuclease [Actinomycetaceae bacterium]
MNTSNAKGRAFEGAVLNALKDTLCFEGKIELGDNPATLNALHHFSNLDYQEETAYSFLALKGIRVIADDIENRFGVIDNPVLYIQSDRNGETGDVRDIVLLDKNGLEITGIS